jgi:hypothetical protein
VFWKGRLTQGRGLSGKGPGITLYCLPGRVRALEQSFERLGTYETAVHRSTARLWRIEVFDRWTK